MDNNDEILKLINERLNLGRERYGHGIRVGDDTRQWGTKHDSWGEMGLEEALDLTLYLASALIRLQYMDEIKHDTSPPKLNWFKRFKKWLLK